MANAPLEQQVAQLVTAITSLTNRAEQSTSSGQSDGPSLDEWKECRASIGRFDTILVDLRKVGFGLLTAVISGAAAFFSSTRISADASVTIGMLVVVLTFGLFAYDRIHASWLKAAVVRALELERKLKFKLTDSISKTYTPWMAITVSHVTYLFFVGLAYAVFGYSVASAANRALFGWFNTLVLLTGLVVFLRWALEVTTVTDDAAPKPEHEA